MIETTEDISSEKEELSKFLEKLKRLESKLWGITVNELANGEEEVLEDSNHLIYLISRGKNHELTDIISSKDVEDFLADVEKLKDDFSLLKKTVREENKLRNFISNLSIKIVSKENYSQLENIFLLESQLYDILERQEDEFNRLIKEVNGINFEDNDEKVDEFLDVLYSLRNILGGHMEHHKLWEEERMGFSNSSNILHSLIKEVRNI